MSFKHYYFRLFPLVLICVFTTVLHAQHTFSIVAVDPATGEVGSAGASCVDSSVIISWLVPGVGAINAQATVCLPNVNLIAGVQWMKAGHTPQEILDSLLQNDQCFAGNNTNRQYGIATLDSMGQPDAIGYTGSNALVYRNHVAGSYYSIQGNILIGQEVLLGMQDSFLNAGGTLADRLMAAMQGANFAGADSRCLSDSVSSLSAFLRVARHCDTADQWYINIDVPSVDSAVEPIDSLQAMYDILKPTFNAMCPGDTVGTGISTKSLNKQLSIYPNPNNGLIRFKVPATLKEPALIEIYDLQGIRFFRKDFNLLDNNVELDLRDTFSSDLVIIKLHLKDSGNYITKWVRINPGR